jgi:HAD superfamily hydrolase (TIGR01549 family)
LTSELIAVFDLDGTLLDSDAALAAPFVRLGIPEEAVTFGHLLTDECERLGISVDDYLAAYDPAEVTPYPGVEDMLAALPRWAVCSNKHGPSGRAELEALGWEPEVAMFTDDFGGFKSLGPVLDALALAGSEILYVGDTEHDRKCAAEVGARFAWAGWNPRAAPQPGDDVLHRPGDVLARLRP